MKALLKIINDNSFKHRPDELLGWLCDDVLADVLKRRKTDPPPQEAMPIIFEMAKAYAKAVTRSPFDDVLGQVYMEVASSRRYSGWMGQFFTPMPVARLIAQMTVTPPDDGYPTDRLIRVMEPASGAGVMLLATIETIANRMGPPALRNWSFTGVDLDPLCAKMTACQLVGNSFMHNMPIGEIAIYHGNSLSLENLKVVIHAGCSSRPTLPAEHPARIAAISDIQAHRVTNAPMVLPLMRAKPPLFGGRMDSADETTAPGRCLV